MKNFLSFLVFLYGVASFSQGGELDVPIFMQDGRIVACSGILYDTGGFEGNYGNDENIVMTICPEDPDTFIQLQFLTFILEGNEDSLTIYDGDSTNAPTLGAAFTGEDIFEFIRATGNNETGCLTLVFSSNGAITAPGFAARISCFGVCQEIIPQIVNTVPAFDRNIVPECGIGVIKACLGDELTFIGAGDFEVSGTGARYIWNFGDGTGAEGQSVSTSYNERGAYTVSLNIEDSEGCINNEAVLFTVQVSALDDAEFELTSDKDEYCLGETAILNAVVTPVPFEFTPPEILAGLTFLPDGSGAVYRTTITVDQYCPSTLIERANQIKVCLNLEHSYAGDLDIMLEGPNGEIINLFRQAGGNTFFGHPIYPDVTLDPGEGETYCFSMDANVLLRNGPTVPSRGAQGNNVMYEPGDYLPVQGFDQFVGAEVNGNWSIIVRDNLRRDNGYIFWWSIEFDEELQPNDLSFEPVIVAQRWLPTPGLRQDGDQYYFSPDAPGVYELFYEITDDYHCTYISPEPLIVNFSSSVIVGRADNLLACANDDGEAVFNLRDVEDSLTTNPDYGFNYFANQADAILNLANIQTDQVLHIDDSPRTVWVRVFDHTGETTCIAIEKFQLIVNNCDVQVNDLPDLAICVDEGVTTGVFDLTVQTSRAFNNTQGYGVTYYTSQADAMAGINEIPIGDLDSFIGTDGQTIFVRVQNDLNAQEFGTQGFRLLLNENPPIYPMMPVIGCPVSEEKRLGEFHLSLNNIPLTAGTPGMEVTYYRTQMEGELGGMNGLLQDYFVSESTTIWARIENIATGCYTVRSLELIVQALPDVDRNVVYEYCDSNNDGIGDFDLNDISREILGRAVTPDLNITYYVSESNALNLVGAFNNPYRNTIPNNQTIYARIAYHNSACFEIIPVQLRINNKPNIIAPTALEACVNSINEEVIFDLTTKEIEILNGLNPVNYSFSYHVQRQHAERGFPVIQNPSGFSNLLGGIAWVRVENINTGCFSIVPIALKSNVAPNVPFALAAYTTCDLNENGFAIFDLGSRIQNIVNGQLGLEVSFYANADEALTDENRLPAMYQNVIPFNQTIFVRIENAQTGCHVVRILNLVVSPLPVLNIPSTPVSVCNLGDGGQGLFDLLSLVNRLQNGVVNVTITFYETESNAHERLNRILIPQRYNNLDPNNPVVWVRGELRGGCYVVKPLHLLVVEAPLIPIDLQDIVLCENFPGINQNLFDLTVQNQTILDAQRDNNPNDLRISYYLSEDDANGGVINRITNETSFGLVANEQQIWVRVDNLSTGCFSISNFNISKNTALILVQPTPITMCQMELPNTGFEYFDLTIRELEILGGQLIFETEFKYYRTKQDALTDRNPIQNPERFRNTVNSQTLWVVVTNMKGCKNIISLTIRVTPLPNVNQNPLPLVKCEGVVGQGLAMFDLKESEADISNHSVGLKFEYYRSENDALNSLDEIQFSSNWVNASGFIWVKVYNNPVDLNDQCFVIVPLELRVVPQPEIAELKPFLICEVNPDGFHTFDLRDKYEEILNGRSLTEHSVAYYLSQNDAIAGVTTPMALTYTNLIQWEQVIWVRLEHKLSGCHFVAPLTLKIEEEVFATEIPNPEPFCDDNDVFGNEMNDGITRIDLTVYDQDIIGVNQNIPVGDLKVDYFASIDDYENNDPIPNPTQFVNSGENPQVIVAAVRNVDPDMLCESIITFEIVVNKRPEVLPIEGGYLCIDLVTNTATPLLIDSKLDAALYDFIWKFNGDEIFGAKSSYYEATEAGRYTVQTIDKVTGCASFNSADAFVTAIDPFTVIIEDDLGGRDEMSDAGSQTIVVRVEERVGKFPAGTYEYALNDGEYQESNIFHNVEAGDHLVWVRDRVTGACALSKVVSIMNYPKYFTPNGDGFNDTWNILGLRSQPNAKVYIFDRTGKLLKQLSPVGDGWDGTYGGRPMPSTDYWFTVEYVDFNGYGREFKGHFSLKR